MICDQYIDIPKGEWTQIPSNATGFCFIIKRQRSGGFSSDNRATYIDIYNSHDPTVAQADAQKIIDANYSTQNDLERYYKWRYTGIQLLPYVRWDDGTYEPDYVRLYYSILKKDHPKSGVSAQAYIELPEWSTETYSEALPSNATNLTIVVKNNSASDTYNIDIVGSHFKEGETSSGGAHHYMEFYSNIAPTSSASLYGTLSISNDDPLLPYMAWNQDGQDTPEWVRVYYNLL